MDYIKLYVSLNLSDRIYTGNRSFASAIRGIWGRSLIKRSCIQRSIDCEKCDLKTCVYNLIFSQQFSDRERFHPYIIREIDKSSDSIVIEFIFLGIISHHMDKVIYSIIDMSKFPLIVEGKRVPFFVESILDQYDQLIYNHQGQVINRSTVQQYVEPTKTSSHIRLSFDTPLRVKYENRFMRDFRLEPMLLSLYRRVDYLNKHFNESAIALGEYLYNEHIRVVKPSFKWVENFRKSFARDQKMSLGGLVGSVELKDVDENTYQLLKLGELVHVGKQTSFGLGKYSVENLDK